MKISEEISKLIEAKVSQCEALSSIEYVPVIVDRSAHYRFFRIILAAGCFLIAQMLCYSLFPTWKLWLFTVVPLALAGGVYSLLSVDQLLAALLPQRFMQEEVEEMARVKFLQHEVFATEKRNGILILISKLERAVFVFADKGFDGKIASDYWIEVGTRLAQDFDAKFPGDSFLNALQELSVRLSNNFPPEARNPNELPDHLRR